MLPLIWFLVAWFILLGLFAIVTMVTLFMHFRFGLTSTGIMTSTIIFLGVIALVLIVTSSYLTQVDWTQSLELTSGGLPGYDLQ